MRTLICMCILSGVLAAQDSTKAAPSQEAPAAAATTKAGPKKAPAISGLPKDAVETKPGYYRWTDKKGRVWTYHLTPFGPTRWPEDSVDTAQEAANKRTAGLEQTMAFEQGDSVRFEQGTPFGKRTWVRKKTELNEAEQRIWDLQQKSSAASRTAEKE